MKLNIAVALSHNAKLLILDEATGGLDPVVRDEILELFLEFMQDEERPRSWCIQKALDEWLKKKGY